MRPFKKKKLTGQTVKRRKASKKVISALAMLISLFNYVKGTASRALSEMECLYLQARLLAETIWKCKSDALLWKLMLRLYGSRFYALNRQYNEELFNRRSAKEGAIKLLQLIPISKAYHLPASLLGTRHCLDGNASGEMLIEWVNNAAMTVTRNFNERYLSLASPWMGGKFLRAAGISTAASPLVAVVCEKDTQRATIVCDVNRNGEPLDFTCERKELPMKVPVMAQGRRLMSLPNSSSWEHTFLDIFQFDHYEQEDLEEMEVQFNENRKEDVMSAPTTFSSEQEEEGNILLEKMDNLHIEEGGEESVERNPALWDFDEGSVDNEGFALHGNQDEDVGTEDVKADVPAYYLAETISTSKAKTADSGIGTLE